jgi:hypothetical protein
VLTDSLCRFHRARNIGLASVVGNISSGLNELIRRRMVSSVTTSCHFRSAVQDVLNREVNVVALTLASNLDTISERRKRSMSPAASTILRNVLVQRMCQVADTVDICPGKRVGHIIGAQIRVRQG